MGNNNGIFKENEEFNSVDKKEQVKLGILSRTKIKYEIQTVAKKKA